MFTVTVLDTQTGFTLTRTFDTLDAANSYIAAYIEVMGTRDHIYTIN